MSYGIIVLGYCDPDVDAAAIREIREGFAFPLTRPVQNELAELLVKVIPCAEMVHFFLKRHRDQVACIIMMPLEIEPPEPGFLAGVKDLAHQHGALFILDEMRSGFHLALGGAQEYYGVTPDLATFSKAISNGYAISVLAGRRELMQELSARRTPSKTWPAPWREARRRSAL